MEQNKIQSIIDDQSSSAAIAAEVALQAISLDLQRKYLDRSNKDFEIVAAKRGSTEEAPVKWIEIIQVGRPVNNSPEQCFVSIQKILQSVRIPHTKLLFLIGKTSGRFSLMLGFKSSGVEHLPIDAFCEYAKGCWNGLYCKPVKDSPVIRNMITSLGDELTIKAITGIPSIKTQYNTLSSSSIDSLLSGMLNKNFYYLVVAEPLQAKDIESVESNIKSIDGSLESLKSVALSVVDSESEQLPPAYKSNITDDEKKRACKKLFEKAIPFWGQANSVNIDRVLQDYLTPPKTTSTNKTINVNVVNKHVDTAVEYLNKQLDRFNTCEAIGAWRTGIYFISQDMSAAVAGAAQLCSMASGADSYLEPLRVHDVNLDADSIRNYFGDFENPSFAIKVKGETYHNHFGSTLDGLLTVLSTEELSYFVNFPLRSVPGISVVDSSPDFNLNKIEGEGKIPFGKLIFGGSVTELDYSIDPLTLSRHALVAGINGSGKTNTILSIIQGLVDKLPFLIIEPAKTEYVDWARKYNEVARKEGKEEIRIYIPGCNQYRGELIPEQLKLNPFEVIWLNGDKEPNTLAHIDRLKTVFATEFPMTDILPVLLEELIYSIYQADSTNWIGRNASPKINETRFPTLNSMSYYVDSVIAHRKYEERVQMNMEACLNTRIDCLKRGWRGTMLNCGKSTDWKILFEKPTLINLSYVGDDTDKSFIMSLILQFLYEYCSAKAEIGEIDFNSNECRHLTIIEEAHRVMSKCDNPELPQYKSAMLFSNMLSEIRAYGESMFLVDQVPTRLIPDALKNTNLKIVHRLVAEDDSRAMGDAMGLSEDQRKMIPKLLTGQSIVSSASDTNAYWVRVNKMK